MTGTATVTAAVTVRATEVIRGQPFAEYAASPETHATALRHLLVSPLAYRRALDADRVETDAMRLGQAGHTAVLEPMEFLRKFALWDGGRRDGKKWDAFKASNAAKTIVTADQYQTAIDLQKAVRGHKVAGEILSRKGEAEIAIRFTHERTGVRIKARIDWLADCIVDLKTTRDVSPRAFAASAVRYGYPLQMYCYYEAARAAGFGELPCKLIAAQSVEPFDVVVYDCSDVICMGVGRDQFERALDLLVECETSKSWPGVAPDRELSLSLPQWAIDSNEDTELTFGGDSLSF